MNTADKNIRLNDTPIDDVAKSLGTYIRAKRSQLGISQEQLAEASGLHRTYIGVIERGEKNITVMNCYRIAVALGIRLSDLLCIIETKRNVV